MNTASYRQLIGRLTFLENTHPNVLYAINIFPYTYKNMGKLTKMLQKGSLATFKS